MKVLRSAGLNRGILDWWDCVLWVSASASLRACWEEGMVGMVRAITWHLWVPDVPVLTKWMSDCPYTLFLFLPHSLSASPLPRKIITHLGQAFEAQDRNALCNQFLYFWTSIHPLNTVLRSSDNTGLHLKLRCRAISSRKPSQDTLPAGSLPPPYFGRAYHQCRSLVLYARAAVNNLKFPKPQSPHL